MIYFDSSYLLKCYLLEPGSEPVRSLAKENEVASCSLAKSECYAGIHRHFREGRLTKPQMQRIFKVMHQDDEVGLWHWFPLDPPLFNLVEYIFKKLPPSVFLRSADALHLASARLNGLEEIYSHDRHLLKAASHFNLIGKDVI